MPVICNELWLSLKRSCLVIDEAGFDIFRGIYDCTTLNPHREWFMGMCVSKLTHMCPPLSVHVCLCVCLSTSEETNNNGMAHWARPRYGRIQKQRRWVENYGGQGGLGQAIFLLSVCQMKVRERLRDVRWQGTEVGSLFRQEMGWKTSGIQFSGGLISERDGGTEGEIK